MFFFLSKIIDFLFSPLSWILIILITGYFLKNEVKKRKLYLTSILLLVIFTNPFIFNLSLLILPNSENITTLNRNNKADVALVLGGLISYDESKDQVSFNSNVNRLTQAIELYKKQLVKKIFITGGSGSLIYPEIREAAILKKYIARYFDIPKEDILIENESNNTYENAKFTKQILIKEKLFHSKIILITSNTHYYRAQKCFEKQGIKTYIAKNTRKRTKTQWILKSMFLPQSDIISSWENLLHEFVGIISYKIMGYI
jgi:uncharacterized SAM-binding protein YcdF (DUF218 family)